MKAKLRSGSALLTAKHRELIQAQVSSPNISVSFADTRAGSGELIKAARAQGLNIDLTVAKLNALRKERSSFIRWIAKSPALVDRFVRAPAAVFAEFLGKRPPRPRATSTPPARVTVANLGPRTEMKNALAKLGDWLLSEPSRLQQLYQETPARLARIAAAVSGVEVGTRVLNKSRVSRGERGATRRLSSPTKPRKGVRGRAMDKRRAKR